MISSLHLRWDFPGNGRLSAPPRALWKVEGRTSFHEGPLDTPPHSKGQWHEATGGAGRGLQLLLLVATASQQPLSYGPTVFLWILHLQLNVKDTGRDGLHASAHLLVVSCLIST